MIIAEDEMEWKAEETVKVLRCRPSLDAVVSLQASLELRDGPINFGKSCA
jgi:hypothetical protein